MLAVQTFTSQEDAKKEQLFLIGLGIECQVRQLVTLFGGDKETDDDVACIVREKPYGIFLKNDSRELRMKIARADSYYYQNSSRIHWVGLDLEKFKKDLYLHVLSGGILEILEPRTEFTIVLNAASIIVDANGDIVFDGDKPKKALSCEYRKTFWSFATQWEKTKGETEIIPPVVVPQDLPAPKQISVGQVLKITQLLRPIGRYFDDTICFTGGSIRLWISDEKREISIKDKRSVQPQQFTAIEQVKIEQVKHFGYAQIIPVPPENTRYQFAD